MSSVYEFLHFANGPLEPHQHRPSDDAVADVQLASPLNLRNRNYVSVRQSVAHVQQQPGFACGFSCGFEFF
jgi:hypothetical protein